MSLRLWLSLAIMFTGLARSRADVVLPAIVTPLISEFMADNDGSLLDGLGEASDWIEVHNPTAVPVNLAGWKLQDSANSWTFPSVPLPAGGYLVVFASGKLAQPYTDSLGYLHTNFRLDATDEPLTLLRPDGVVAWAYPAPGPQRRGVSFGLLETTTPLSTFESPARLLVHTAPVPDAWRTNLNFSDASWLNGQASAGYGTVSGGTVAYRVHTATPGNQPIGESLGMDFLVNREVIVTELGCFDDNGDGLARTITVQLWRRHDNGTPDYFADDTGVNAAASLVFTSADPGTLLEGSRFKPLSTPVTLAPGSYSILAWGYGEGERAGNLGVSSPPEPWETQSGGGALSFVGSARPGLAGTFPTNPDGGPANRYAAGTFKFVEPNDPLLRTPLQAAMQNVSASALMRVPFTISAPGVYASLVLN
ncbi:MAG TPA: lamin tail domain-containing protein, partial [Candidatus Dormibacteraeota bacterium]|nr:lamin tail domain-containing protein [Candidatus Dormibacteraeota bacterium]